jgi:hypothetical protein
MGPPQPKVNQLLTAIPRLRPASDARSPYGTAAARPVPHVRDQSSRHANKDDKQQKVMVASPLRATHERKPAAEEDSGAGGAVDTKQAKTGGVVPAIGTYRLVERLAKRIARSGLCSRREAERLIGEVLTSLPSSNHSLCAWRAATATAQH